MAQVTGLLFLRFIIPAFRAVGQKEMIYLSFAVGWYNSEFRKVKLCLLYKSNVWFL